MAEYEITCLCGKHKATNMSLSELKDVLDNAIFESKEDEDSIEHIDMGYKAFMNLVDEIINAAMFEGAKSMLDSNCQHFTPKVEQDVRNAPTIT